MPVNDKQTLYVATTLADAVAALAERGNVGAPLAGATWIMRAPIRRERHDLFYVAIGKIDELRHLSVLDREVSIGACVTHAELATTLASLPEYGGLVKAAASAANPAIREVATIGGNLCTAQFAASDLVPALLCLDADLELGTPGGTERITIEQFLRIRSTLEPGNLLLRIIIPRSTRRSVHARLPLRKAGDYPVAIVSLAAKLNSNGVIDDIQVAIGSVEPVARRWDRLEAELIGHPCDPHHAASKAEELSGDFQGRDGIEAPGWYRVKVLPSLVRRAVTALQEQL